jgi:hypothetical protein
LDTKDQLGCWNNSWYRLILNDEMTKKKRGKEKRNKKEKRERINNPKKIVGNWDYGSG